jgi:hypothetical protein
VLAVGGGVVSACPVCGGFDYLHDAVAHGFPESSERAACLRGEHDWMDFGGPGDEWRECFACGKQEDA